MLNFEFASIASAFGVSAPAQPAQPAQSTAPAPSLTDKLAEVFAGKDEQVNAFLIARQQIKTGQTWRDVAPDYGQRVVAKPQDFIRAVEEFTANGGAK